MNVTADEVAANRPQIVAPRADNQGVAHRGALPELEKELERLSQPGVFAPLTIHPGDPEWVEREEKKKAAEAKAAVEAEARRLHALRTPPKATVRRRPQTPPY